MSLLLNADACAKLQHVAVKGPLCITVVTHAPADIGRPISYPAMKCFVKCEPA